jgi:hypothetical protein
MEHLTIRSENETRKTHAASFQRVPISFSPSNDIAIKKEKSASNPSG